MHLELRFLRLLALVSGLTFGPALFCISFVEWRLEVRLLQQGEVVEAEVTDLAIHGQSAYSSFPWEYDIRYRFRVGNLDAWYCKGDWIGRRNLWSSLPRPNWEEAQRTQRIDVVYLPDNPWTNSPVKSDDVNNVARDWIFFAFVFIVSLMLAIYARTDYHKALTSMDNGEEKDYMFFRVQS
jgi:hypothetical protein